MLAEWSVECGADDPILVVPWTLEPPTLESSTPGPSITDPGASFPAPAPLAPTISFVDLREDPYALDQIPEAELHPALAQALRALNAIRSPVFTAKCDAWVMAPDELASTQHNLDLPPAEAPYGFASYLDLLWRERTLFVSFHQGEGRLIRLARLLDPVDAPYAAVECVLRPALVDLIGPQEGFAISLYVKALGTDPAHAYEHWSKALQSVVTLLRSKELSLA